MSENGVNSAKSASKESVKGEESVKSGAKGAKDGQIVMITYKGISVFTAFYDEWLKAHNLNPIAHLKSWPNWPQDIKDKYKTPEDKWKREYMNEPVSDE